MTRLEQIEFDSWDKLILAIEKIKNGEEVFRTYSDKDNKPQRKKIISNHNLYLGNNYSLNINEGTNKKIYVSINYFGADDRIRMAKHKAEFSNANEL